ncbi:MAG: 50S ribosomal protein L10 [Nocardioidaceae bacterium]
MARPDKAAAVAELADEFRSSQGAVLTEYRGLTVKQLQELRRALGDNASYAVVKNTLTKIAAREAGVEGFDDLLTGPSAIAFIKGDPVATAKSLRDFAKANSPLVIKGGILDGKSLTIGEISKIADLESREVILARLAGAMIASLQNAVTLFNAPLSKVARLAGALQAKREQEAPATDAAPDAAPVDADEAPEAESSTEEAPRA